MMNNLQRTDVLASALITRFILDLFESLVDAIAPNQLALFQISQHFKSIDLVFG